MPDVLCCADCGQVFELNRITAFVEHKVKGCYKRPSSLNSLIQCAYCNFIFMLPLDLIAHVQSVHNVPVIKMHENEADSDTLTKPQCCNTVDEAYSSATSNGSTANINDAYEACHPMSASVDRTPDNYGSIETNEVNCEENQSSIGRIRKTCCLVDGGSPCEQITSCPILASYTSGPGSCPMSTDFSNDKINSSVSRSPDGQLSRSDAPFTCEYCSSSFKQKIHLKKHLMSTHLRQKPFKCNTCGYATVERSHLKIHVRRHTGERPFACMLCSYRAAQNVTLKRHCLKKHQSTFIGCSSCGTQCVTLTELENHKKLRKSLDLYMRSEEDLVTTIHQKSSGSVNKYVLILLIVLDLLWSTCN
ncbi:unnamed protein product [Echinostoma caproni]|uniref:C2H2-type domain-containing protein n=1 Tax=Echinostoma caproni TaxID=27848 RepID=A0A183AKQ9_9TREM|nr:unnamed protein product [Echinostoma caproni]